MCQDDELRVLCQKKGFNSALCRNSLELRPRCFSQILRQAGKKEVTQNRQSIRRQHVNICKIISLEKVQKSFTECTKNEGL